MSGVKNQAKSLNRAFFTFFLDEHFSFMQAHDCHGLEFFHSFPPLKRPNLLTLDLIHNLSLSPAEPSTSALLARSSSFPLLFLNTLQNLMSGPPSVFSLLSTNQVGPGHFQVFSEEMTAGEQ